MDQLLAFLLLTFAAALDHGQRRIIAYLRAEIHVLREQLGDRRLQFTDPQRIRLAKRARKLGRKALHELDTLVTPDTLLAWYRKLVAKKYTAKTRKQGRSGTHEEIEQLVIEIATSNST